MSTALQIIFWIAFGLMAYAHVGYPLLMALLARLRRQRALEECPLPAVSLIIPAYNEEGVLQEKLENATSIDYPRDKLEIIVASDGSEDGTLEIAKAFADQITLLAFEQRRGKASVLNDAVSQAKHDVICLCDANVMFKPEALKLLVAHLSDPRVGSVSGDVQLQSYQSNFEEGESTYYKIERSLQMNESQVGSTMGAEGGMYVLRRDAFSPLRADTILDDLVILMDVLRSGHRAVYEPTAIAIENGTPLAKDEFRRRIRVAAGAVQVLKRGQFPPLTRPIETLQFLSHKLLRWMGPIWLLAMLVTSILLWGHSPIYKVAVIGQAICYALGTIACWAVPLRASRIVGIIFYFFISHVAMGIGMFLGLFNLQSVKWRRTAREAEPAST